MNHRSEAPMKNFFELFQDKKAMINIAVLLALGLLLLIMSSSLFKNEPAKSDETNRAVEGLPKTDSVESYETGLERRLEEALSQVSGVGQVKVLLTISYGREIIVAENSVRDESTTKETDSTGGSREVYSIKTDDKVVFAEDDGQPLILKEISPKIEGVLIVAQGGDNVVLKEAMIKAAGTVLGVEPHKVQVLKMK